MRRLLVLACFLTAAGTTAGVLLDEDFSGSSIPSGWTVTSGNASVSSSDRGQALYLNSACVQLPGSFSRSKDLVLEADVKIVDETFGDFNIWSFYDAVSTCSGGPDQNGYYLGLYPTGSDNPKDTLYTRKSGQTTLIDDNPTSVTGDAWFHMKFRLQANGTIDVSKDGTTILSGSNTHHTQGKLMFRSWYGVWIDNVVISDTTSTGSPPTADFTWSPAQPVIERSVDFTDRSTGNPTSWSWSFGDGISTTTQNPWHAYQSVGTYTVSLTASNASGSSTKTKTIAISSESSTTLGPCLQGRTYEYLIPASAHAPGANNTFFETDASFRNLGGNDANVTLILFERDQDNGTVRREKDIVIPSLQTRTMDDVVWTAFFQDSTAGAIHICADQPLVALSRTYNATSQGTLGQGIPASPMTSAIQPLTFGTATFMVENASYRTNLGIINLSPQPNQVNAIFRDKNGTSIGTAAYVLPPYGYIQKNSVLRTYTNSNLDGAGVDLITQDAPFMAYLSIVDNQTGDPTYFLIQTP